VLLANGPHAAPLLAATVVETQVGDDVIRTNVIGEEGFEAFCADVGVDPYEDAFAIQILGAMAAEDPTNISKEQFRRGMVSMYAHNAAELKKQRAKLEKEARSDRKAFLRLWTHAFKANRETGMRVVTSDVIVGLLDMFTPDWSLKKEFEAFLETKKHVSLDTWKQLLRFQSEVKADLSGYDEDMAWPTAIDEFVDFVRKQRGGSASASGGGGGSGK